MNKVLKSNNKGFTLVELLIASAIFTVFMGAAFTLYRQGGKMFSNGSWRQITQKSAETFFNTLRDKISHCTSPLDVDNQGYILGQQRSIFNLRTGSLNASDVNQAGEVLLAYFPIWISPTYDSSNAVTQGVLMYNLLMAKPSDKFSNVFDLEFRSVADSKDLETQAHNNLFITLQLGTSNQPLNMTNFGGDPSLFGLGSRINVFRINDVASLTISLKEPLRSDNSSFMGENGMFNMKVQFKQPKDDNVELNIETAASIDSEVSVTQVN